MTVLFSKVKDEYANVFFELSYILFPSKTTKFSHPLHTQAIAQQLSEFMTRFWPHIDSQFKTK